MDILPQLLVNSLITGSLYALASAGLSLVYGLTRVLNFAHGHILMFGAYIFYCATKILEWNILLSSLFSFLAVVALALFAFRFFVAPFLQFNPILVFVTTLALGTMIEALISMKFGVNIQSLEVGNLMQSYEFYGVFITPIQIMIIASAVFLLSLVAVLIHSTAVGRFIRALSENSASGQSIGIDQRLVFYSVFVLGSLLAAFAGIMIAYETNLHPLMGNSYTIKAFAVMILGGLGSFWGTIIASYILGITENFSIGLDFWGYSLPAGYKDAFAFVIILIVLLVRPRGLFGKKLRQV